MSEIDLPTSKRIAQAATQGEWSNFSIVNEDGSDMSIEDMAEYVANSVRISGKKSFYLVGGNTPEGERDICHSGNGPTSSNNAEHIAHFDPIMTLSLIERIEELEEHNKRLAALSAELRGKAEYLRFSEDARAFPVNEAIAKFSAEVLSK